MPTAAAVVVVCGENWIPDSAAADKPHLAARLPWIGCTDIGTVGAGQPQAGRPTPSRTVPNLTA